MVKKSGGRLFDYAPFAAAGASLAAGRPLR
jgi:hypothetical protein